MNFVSCFSGIEAASVAWHPLGFNCLAVAEVEPFPCAVLAYHAPDVPNLGDVLADDFLHRVADLAPDAIVGGPPCQDFSVAGLRAGIHGDRGNLTFRWVQIIHASRARFAVTENVPGWLSANDGHAFGAFLAGLVGHDTALLPPKDCGGRWTNSGMVAGPLGRCAWRILDAQYFGLAQRRKRVFVVFCPGNRNDPAAILFESKSVRRDIEKGREKRERTTGSLAARTRSGGGLGTDFDCDGGLIAETVRSHPRPGSNSVGNIAYGISPDCFDRSGDAATGTAGDRSGLGVDCEIAYAIRAKRPGGVAMALNAHGGSGRLDGESETFVASSYRTSGNCGAWDTGDRVDALNTFTDPNSHVITHSLRADGFDASEDGTGRGTPLVTVGFQSNAGGQNGEVYEDLSPAIKAQATGGSGMPAIAYALSSHAGAADGDQTNRSHASGGPVGSGISEELSHSLRSGRTQSIASSAVRRLTPRECERLQGFPDDYTLIPYRGKMAADGNRYRALGNSMAVPVMAWIGQRIAKVEQSP